MIVKLVFAKVVNLLLLSMYFKLIGVNVGANGVLDACFGAFVDGFRI
jgi:hypothetical protein